MSVPADSDAITPKWLTAVLQEARAPDHAQVTSIQSPHIGQLAFGGKQIRRLQISYDKAEYAAMNPLRETVMWPIRVSIRTTVPSMPAAVARSRA
jgi:hypothetical protein